MRHAKLFSLVVMVLVLGYGAVGFYFLPLATFQGELTRMALLPESHFGWTRPQPKIEPRWLQQTSLKDADVIVIGDSFSYDRLWQSVLARQGLKVRTESWNSMGGLCADFSVWLRAHGFKGKTVIIEIVERNLRGTLSQSLACQQTRHRPLPYLEATPNPPPVSFDIHAGNYRGKLSTGIQTRLNQMQYERYSKTENHVEWRMPNNVTVSHVKNGCALFSHISCEDALFLSEDRSEDIDMSLLEQVESLAQRIDGFTPLWVFVPNKSTTYRYPDKRFWDEAERRVGAPNLLRANLEALQLGAIDLYPGSGTHFSTAGYLMMGAQIADKLQSTAPNAPQ